MIPSSSAASASFRLSFNNSATQARGPFNKLTGVSNTNSQLVRKDAEQQFISHSKSVSELLTQAVSLAKSTLNTSETDSAHTVQRSVSGNISCDTVDSRADVAQVSRGAGSASLNEKIAVALDSLPSGRQFSVGKSEAAKTELFNDLTFSFKDNTLDKFAAIIENADGKSDRSSKAMQCVNDFMVMRHEIKSRLSPDDSKTLKELDNVTKSFISKIVKNGVGMNSFAAGSSKNYSGLKQFQGICNKLVALDKQSQGASGLSHNVDISNRILNALNAAGLSHEESLQVESLFRDSIEQHNDMLSGINNSQNLTPFEQAQTRLGHETIIFDLLANKLADMAQPKADDAANTGPEVKAGPSNQPGINITINAPFTYSYHEGNQGSEIPGMASGSQPASATTPDATQTDETAEVGTLSEDIDSSTDPQQNTQRREVENIFERSVQQTPDLSERHIHTTSAAGSPDQLVSRGSGDATDAVNEQHHDVTDAVTGPAVQPTRQDTQRREVENIFERSVQQTPDLSERHTQTTSVAGSPGSAYIGGPGSSSARTNPAESRRTALNNQGTSFQGLNRGQMGGTQDTQRREVENIFERSVQQTPDLSERHIQTTSAAGSPGSAYIGGPGSSSARTNPAESRRTALNNQGTSFQGLNRGQMGGTQDTQRREVENIFERSVQQTPDLSERHIQTTSVAGSPGSAYIGGPGSSSARTNPAESRRTALNNQGTPFQGLNRGQTGGTQDTQRREVENIFERSVQQTPDLSERHTQTTSAAGSPGSAYIGGPGSSSARTNPAESRRTALNNQGTPFQGLNRGQTEGTQDTQRREVNKVFERSVQQTPDLSERHIQTTSAAGSPGSAYIGGPGSSSARTNPAESRRTALNSQGTPFQGLNRGQTEGTQDTQRREVNKVSERSVQQTSHLSERHIQTTSVAGSPGSAYIGGPGSSSARTNPAESRRTALNSQGTPFQGLNGGRARGTAGAPASTGTSGLPRDVGTNTTATKSPRMTPGGTGTLNHQRSQQDMIGGQARRATGNSAPSGAMDSSYIGGPGSSRAPANPAEARRSTQDEPGMLNRQGTHWQGMDGKQASKVIPEQTYKSSSFIGSRGSSQATPDFSGVSKSTVKK